MSTIDGLWISKRVMISILSSALTILFKRLNSHVNQCLTSLFLYNLPLGKITKLKKRRPLSFKLAALLKVRIDSDCSILGVPYLSSVFQQSAGHQVYFNYPLRVKYRL